MFAIRQLISLRRRRDAVLALIAIHSASFPSPWICRNRRYDDEAAAHSWQMGREAPIRAPLANDQLIHRTVRRAHTASQPWDPVPRTRGTQDLRLYYSG